MEGWLVVALVLLSGNCLGANCVERFVNYQTCPAIEAASFRAYHQAQSPLIRWFVVVPLGLSTLQQMVLLLFDKQAEIDGRPVWIMLVSSLLGASR